MTWKSVLILKPSTERFEQRMNVKIIVGRIIKGLMKNKTIYRSELIYNHSQHYSNTSLTMFLMRRPESFLLTGPAKALVLKKMLLFSSGNMFCFVYKWGV